MPNQTEYESRLPLARRKEILLAKGAVYRSALSSAKNAVQAKLQAESLAQSIIRNLAIAAFGALKSRGTLGGIGLRTVVPLIAGGFSVLKKVRLKPVLRGALLAGAVGVAAGFMVKRKKARDAARQASGQSSYLGH